jgi:hypothetical protein
VRAAEGLSDSSSGMVLAAELLDDQAFSGETRPSRRGGSNTPESGTSSGE